MVTWLVNYSEKQDFELVLLFYRFSGRRNDKRRFLYDKDESITWLTSVESYEEKQLMSLKEFIQRIRTLINDEVTKKLVGEAHI